MVCIVGRMIPGIGTIPDPTDIGVAIGGGMTHGDGMATGDGTPGPGVVIGDGIALVLIGVATLHMAMDVTGRDPDDQLRWGGLIAIILEVMEAVIAPLILAHEHLPFQAEPHLGVHLPEHLWRKG